MNFDSVLYNQLLSVLFKELTEKFRYKFNFPIEYSTTQDASLKITAKFIKHISNSKALKKIHDYFEPKQSSFFRKYFDYVNNFL